jgi:uncharacterized membrane-anchored protein YjiN (DUF445 family)
MNVLDAERACVRDDEAHVGESGCAAPPPCRGRRRRGVSVVGSTVARRNHVGSVSLLVTVIGAALCRLGLVRGPFAGAAWLQVLAAGFEAALVGGLADWFAVTALFRHPLGLPIPHTAIIPARRVKIIESIVSMVQDEWLSPDVIGARLARLSPSELVLDWLRDPAHVERLGGPLRDFLRALARVLVEPEVVAFVERTVQRSLREVPLDAAAGRWLARAATRDSTAAAFTSAARSLANLARQPGTAATLQQWLDRAAAALRRDGKRLVPLLLRRKVVQRALVESACDYAAVELAAAADEPGHPLRRGLIGAVERFAARLESGDADTLAQLDQLRAAVVESLDAQPVLRRLLTQLQQQLEHDLAEPAGYLATLVDRRLRTGIVELLDDAERRSLFDRWLRSTAEDLLRRHHHQIGLTVRENLDALETHALVAQIEARVGADLQFIRLNGALVGGLIGVALALLHRLAP